MVTLHKGTPMTLKAVFQSMNLSTYDLTVDMLDVHAVSERSYYFILFLGFGFPKLGNCLLQIELLVTEFRLIAISLWVHNLMATVIIIF